MVLMPDNDEALSSSDSPAVAVVATDDVFAMFPPFSNRSLWGNRVVLALSLAYTIAMIFNADWRPILLLTLTGATLFGSIWWEFSVHAGRHRLEVAFHHGVHCAATVMVKTKHRLGYPTNYGILATLPTGQPHTVVLRFEIEGEQHTIATLVNRKLFAELEESKTFEVRVHPRHPWFWVPVND